MSGLLHSTVAFIVAIGLLISVHEFGHFWVARRLGVKVLRFSIGFGKPLWSRRGQVDGTEYVVAAIPLGGYVKMLDEREGEVPAAELPRAFNRQTLGVRSAIVVAGPLFNLLFAVVAYWVLYVAGIDGLRPVVGQVAPDSVAALGGVRDGDEILAVDGRGTPTWEAVGFALMHGLVSAERTPLTVRDADGRETELVLETPDGHRLIEGGALLQNLGLTPWQPRLPAVVERVVAGGAAERAGLQAGDLVVQADGEAIADWGAWVRFVRERPAVTFPVTVERAGARVELELTPESVGEGAAASGRIGAQARVPEDLFEGMHAEFRLGPLDAAGEALRKTWEMGGLMLRMLGKMVIGEASLQNINGPLSIAEYAGRTASIGLAPFLTFLAVISISLGVLNLLPVPLLDGGHLLYYLIELVKGSPVSEHVEILGQRIGIALLLLLMGLAFYNDLVRLFGG
ncbi:MAG TPA: RIP metalloprotease RseP [Gammaproteobacteria bacterium]